MHVPTTTKLNEALDICKKRRVHMLIVTDAAGGEGSGAAAAAGGAPPQSPLPAGAASEAPAEGADDDRDGGRLAAALGVSPSGARHEGRNTSVGSAAAGVGLPGSSVGAAVGIAVRPPRARMRP